MIQKKECGKDMIPGMRGLDTRRMAAMMKRLGIKVEELRGVKEVIIVLSDKKIVIEGAEVTVMDMQGQKTYQVVGEARELPIDGDTGAKVGPKIPIEDIKMVAEKAGVSEAEARKALEDTGGDIAEAIIKLMGG